MTEVYIILSESNQRSNVNVEKSQFYDSNSYRGPFASIDGWQKERIYDLSTHHLTSNIDTSVNW